MKIDVTSFDGQKAGSIELSDEVFGLDPRKDLIFRMIRWQLAKRRSGQHKVLTRGEINRTKKKLYKQKGTGQARHGARSAPLFVGGAKAMGPVAHSHEFDLPKKVEIHDATLRDGEQTPGVVFSPEDKIAMAEMMSDVGIDRIEALVL